MTTSDKPDNLLATKPASPHCQVSASLLLHSVEIFLITCPLGVCVIIQVLIHGVNHPYPAVFKILH